MQRKSDRECLSDELRRAGIADEPVLAALREVPRELFIPAEQRAHAWENRALPIGQGQTISQPYMIGLMTSLLELQGTEHVLEIGTGSGYQAAVLARLCRRVTTIERIPELSHAAHSLLKVLGVENVVCHVADGSLGWPAEAPYEGIIVTAGAPEIPWSLYSQLTPFGRLVVPVGDGSLWLKTVDRTPSGPQITDVCQCRFVPLIGAEGWSGTDE